jgi:WD40 repeat protein/tRNA A-37 threonylcarbamoyl transferase component Bud32
MSAELLRERYEPLDVVGRGGEGEVIRALDHLHARHVALKVRPAGDETSRALLLSEARLLLSLEPHPGLPLVREDFFVDGRYFIAMDWIEGRDLEAVLAAEGNPGLDPERTIDYLEHAAEALEHLRTHDPPVVHGDVKPANLVLTSAGRVVLVDFGLSSRPDDDARRAGTSGFVAPEVAAGERPTPAADVYSFAATAVALLTGDPPAGGPRTWGAIEADRIPALERIVGSNLAADPARRDESATAFVARLRRWWGADLPSGNATLVLADVDTRSARQSEAAVDALARAHRGHCVSPVADGPLLVAFESTQDGVDAAREIAGGHAARVAVATGHAVPDAGTYAGQPTTVRAAHLLEFARPGQILVDDPTAETMNDRLPPEMGFSRLRDAGVSMWALVAPGLVTTPLAAACPYRGLIAFEPDDGDLFFGREEIVASILDRLADSGFIAVVGASGSGKSSLVRAGLVPAFRRHRTGDAVVLTPGSDPVGALETALAAGPPSLVVVDQLEEVFTLCADDASRAPFVDALLDVWEAKAASVIVALRADFYGRCADHQRLAAAFAEHQHLLGPMQSDELRRAIESPARAAGLRLEAGLVDAILADVEGEPGALPLLSHALYESWVRRDGRVLTLAGYRGAGGVRGAIAHTADEVFLGCGEPEQVLMRQMFLRLTELGEGTEDTRRRVPLTELVPQGEDDAEATAVLEKLAAARLLVVDDASAEIAHEALIREWPRLRGWLTEDRDELRIRQQLATAARSWDENGRDDADLYRGTRLEAAVELPGDGRQLVPLEREFVEASRTAQERELLGAQRRARRLRILLAVVAVALVIAVIAGAFALVQRGSARHTATVAQAGRLAAQSREVAAQHPDLATLLALEAGRLDDSVDSRGALLGALEHGARIKAWLQGFDAPVNGAAFSPDGELLAAVTQHGATLWDTATWKRAGAPLPAKQGRGEGLDFSPDGRTLAIAGEDGRIELWDVATRTKARSLTDPAAVSSDQPALAAVRFSPDGSVVAAGGLETNHVTLWDVESGRVIGRPIITHRPGSGSQSISFTPDSKRIAVPGTPGTVVIWDVASGKRVGKPLTVGNASVNAAIFSKDGRSLIATDDSGAVTVLDVRSGRRVGTPLSVGNQVADHVDVSPDGRLVAVASFGGSVYVWDTTTGTLYGSPLTADSSPVADVVFSPDGRTLVSSHLRSAVAWDLSGRQVLGEPLGGTDDVATGVAFSPDGRRLVAGQLDGDTIVYDAATRREELRVEGDSVVGGVAVHPAGKLVAVGTLDGKVRFFDLESGAAVGAPLDLGDAAVWQIAFSPDGRLLAVAVDPNGVDAFRAQKSQGELQLWDVASRRRVGHAIVPGAGSVLSLAFSGDGSSLATGSYAGQVDVWDTATQRRAGEPMTVTDDGFLSVALDPAGDLVAAGEAIGPVRVWRVSDQQPAFPPLSGHPGYVTGATFRPDGGLLATTDVFGGTRLWDPATGLAYGDELKSPWPDSLEPNVPLPFLGLRNAFSPDGTRLATAGADGRAMVWDVDPAVWRERACAIVGRNLTREEWKLYLPAGTPYRSTCSEWPSG